MLARQLRRVVCKEPIDSARWELPIAAAIGRQVLAESPLGHPVAIPIVQRPMSLPAGTKVSIGVWSFPSWATIGFRQHGHRRLHRSVVLEIIQHLLMPARRRFRIRLSRGRNQDMMRMQMRIPLARETGILDQGVGSVRAGIAMGIHHRVFHDLGSDRRIALRICHRRNACQRTNRLRKFGSGERCADQSGWCQSSGLWPAHGRSHPRAERPVLWGLKAWLRCRFPRR